MEYRQGYDSPLGRILLTADDEGLTGLWFVDGGQRGGRGPSDGSGAGESPYFDAARRWLDAYFSGRDPGFTPPLHLMGTAFCNRVAGLLLEIPYGQTTTYGALARCLAQERGGGASAQAVGGAVARNPILLIMPCHRVIGADGSLTGYSGGLWRKRALLENEIGDCSLSHLSK